MPYMQGHTLHRDDVIPYIWAQEDVGRNHNHTHTRYINVFTNTSLHPREHFLSLVCCKIVLVCGFRFHTVASHWRSTCTFKCTWVSSCITRITHVGEAGDVTSVHDIIKMSRIAMSAGCVTQEVTQFNRGDTPVCVKLIVDQSHPTKLDK